MFTQIVSSLGIRNFMSGRKSPGHQSTELDTVAAAATQQLQALVANELDGIHGTPFSKRVRENRELSPLLKREVSKKVSQLATGIKLLNQNPKLKEVIELAKAVDGRDFCYELSGRVQRENGDYVLVGLTAKGIRIIGHRYCGDMFVSQVRENFQRRFLWRNDLSEMVYQRQVSARGITDRLKTVAEELLWKIGSPQSSSSAESQ